MRDCKRAISPRTTTLPPLQRVRRGRRRRRGAPAGRSYHPSNQLLCCFFGPLPAFAALESRPHALILAISRLADPTTPPQHLPPTTNSRLARFLLLPPLLLLQGWALPLSGLSMSVGPLDRKMAVGAVGLVGLAAGAGALARTEVSARQAAYVGCVCWTGGAASGWLADVHRASRLEAMHAHGTP